MTATLKTAAAMWLAEQALIHCWSLKTLANHRRDLDQFTDVLPARLTPARLTKRHILTWSATLTDLAPATAHGRCGLVRRFVTSVRPDLADFVPRPRLPRSVPRALPEHALSQVWAVLPDQRARCIVALMLGAGLRCGEVARLDMADYDEARQVIHVTGKAGHQRMVPLSEWVALEVARHLNGRANGPVIGLHPNTVSQYVGHWFRWAGVKTKPRDGKSAHALRHTAATAHYGAVRDIKATQQFLGHARMATTAIYVATDVSDAVRLGVDLIPPPKAA